MSKPGVGLQGVRHVGLGGLGGVHRLLQRDVQPVDRAVGPDEREPLRAAAVTVVVAAVPDQHSDRRVVERLDRLVVDGRLHPGVIEVDRVADREDGAGVEGCRRLDIAIAVVAADRADAEGSAADHGQDGDGDRAGGQPATAAQATSLREGRTGVGGWYVEVVGLGMEQLGKSFSHGELLARAGSRHRRAGLAVG